MSTRDGQAGCIPIPAPFARYVWRLERSNGPADVDLWSANGSARRHENVCRQRSLADISDAKLVRPAFEAGRKISAFGSPHETLRCSLGNRTGRRPRSVGVRTFPVLQVTTGHPSSTFRNFLPVAPHLRPTCRRPRQATAAGRKGTMAKEICISSTPHETRLAILEDDQLAEIYYERENEYTLAGSIYNGRVTRVLPGMQSAFVDLGLERDAFLYVTDFLELEDQEESDELEKAAASGGNQPPREVRHGNGQDRSGRTVARQDREQRPDAPISSRAREPRDRSHVGVQRCELLRIPALTGRGNQMPGKAPTSGAQALARTPAPPRRPRSAATLPHSGGEREFVETTCERGSELPSRTLPRRSRLRQLRAHSTERGERLDGRAAPTLRASRRIASEVRRQRPLRSAKADRSRSSGPPRVDFQARDADRDTDRVGRQRIAAGRIDFAARGSGRSPRRRFMAEAASSPMRDETSEQAFVQETMTARQSVDG